MNEEKRNNDLPVYLLHTDGSESTGTGMMNLVTMDSLKSLKCN